MSSNNIRNDMTNPSFAEDEVVRGMLNADDLLSNSAISNNNKRGNQSGSPTNEDTSNTFRNLFTSSRISLSASSPTFYTRYEKNDTNHINNTNGLEYTLQHQKQRIYTKMAMQSSHYCTCGAHKLMEEELDAILATLNTEKQIELQRQAESYENDILEYKVMLQRLETKLITQSFAITMRLDEQQDKKLAVAEEDGVVNDINNNIVDQQSEKERILINKLQKHKSRMKEMLNVIDKANLIISTMKGKFGEDEKRYLIEITKLKNKNKMHVEQMKEWEKNRLEQSEKIKNQCKELVDVALLKGQAHGSEETIRKLTLEQEQRLKHVAEIHSKQLELERSKYEKLIAAKDLSMQQTMDDMANLSVTKFENANDMELEAGMVQERLTKREEQIVELKKAAYDLQNLADSRLELANTSSVEITLLKEKLEERKRQVKHKEEKIEEMN